MKKTIIPKDFLKIYIQKLFLIIHQFEGMVFAIILR